MTTLQLQFRAGDVTLVLDGRAVDLLGIFLTTASGRYHVDYFGVIEKDKGDELQVKVGNVQRTGHILDGHKFSIPKSREPEYRAFLAAVQANRTT